VSSKPQRREISREEAAAEVLIIWEETYISLRTAMEQLATEWGITNWRIRTAIHSLVFETVRRLNTLDFVLNSILEKTQIIDLDPLTRNTLRVASYLILFGKVAPALPTNEAVAITKRRRNKRLAGLVNAVLRKVQQHGLNEILQTALESNQTALFYSVPQWLYDYALNLLGPEEAKAFFTASLENPPVYIRVNTLQPSAESAINRLEQEQFQCIQIPPFPEVYKLQRGEKPVTQTNAYIDHSIYIQSLASALVSHVLDPNFTDIVIDLCAAPGSKTSHIAQLMKNHGAIIAVDSIVPRTQELYRNLTRLGVQSSHVLLSNSFSLPFREDFRADRVLVDPPCSNTGVIQTRPEAKWIVTSDLVHRLHRVQAGLLREGSRLVADNGFMVYSTCSITLIENEQVIRSFLTNNSEFTLVQAEPRVGKEAFEGMTQCQRLFPHRNNTEGFFIAKLQRKPESRTNSK
jgi:16S rRNA (cytosine967-C5)-methyltransferase